MIALKTFSKKHTLQLLFLLFLFFFSSGFLKAYAETQDVFDTLEERDAFVFKGDLISLKVYSLTRIAVTTPGIVQILNADVDQILLVGKKVGETPMYIWDEHGKRAIVIHCFTEDVETIIPRIQALLDSAKIKGVTFDTNRFEGKIVALGKVTKDQREVLSGIFDRYGQHIIDMVREEGVLIQIDAQITELTTTLSKELGVEWTNSFQYNETIPTTDGDFWDLFKIGDFSRSTAITATVNALLSEGKAQVLSKPSIVVTNEESASFLVGGEIPVVTSSTAASGTTTENVSFKSYGVNITVTPQVVDDKIDIDLNVSISEPGESYGDNASYTTTSASTKLRLNDKQTIVLAGLIKHNATVTDTKVPFMHAIPIVGLLFRNRYNPVTDKEIVISLTPTILRDKKAKERREKDTGTQKEQIVESEEEGVVLEDKMAGDLPEEEFLEEEGEEREGQPQAILEEYGQLQEKSLLEENEEALKEEEEDLGPGDEDQGEAADQETKSIHQMKMQAAIDELSEEGFFDDKKASLAGATTTETGQAYLSEGVKTPSQAIAAYVQAIQKKISQTISFPYKAKERGWEGTVKLSLTVLSDGSLNNVALKESSGYSIFDEDAVNTTQILAPFDAFPAEIDLEEIVVTIPIVYSQKAFLEGLTEDK